MSDEDDLLCGKRALERKREAENFENTLSSGAKLLGLRIKVTRDSYSYHVDAALLPPRQTLTISDELFYVAETKAFADLVSHEMEDLQSRVFDETRKFLDERDWRKRIVRLSYEDKETLHDMFVCACQHVTRDYVSSEHGGRDQMVKYQTLVEKLFR